MNTLKTLLATDRIQYKCDTLVHESSLLTKLLVISIAANIVNSAIIMFAIWAK